jgi:hypothetical protein
MVGIIEGIAESLASMLRTYSGYLCYGLVYLGFSFATAAFHVWALFAFYGFYSGLTEGVEKALVSELYPGESLATMLGIHASLVGIGLLPASIVGGLLWNILGPEAPFYFGGGVGIGYVLCRPEAGACSL